MYINQTGIRNIAIIAHVDHGKTTLVNALLEQSTVLHAKQVLQERALDRHALERERGITILAKCVALLYKDIKINLIDTPGHADFSGEVERILSMVDGALLLVDSVDGPMPQTKFVLAKALQAKLRIILVINKVDRINSRVQEVLDEILALFIDLNATDEQLDFPVIYASAREGWSITNFNAERKDLTALLQTMIEYIPPPCMKHKHAPFAMLASLLEADKFLGRVLIGKVQQGKAHLNMPVKGLNLKNEIIEKSRLTKLQTFWGLERVNVEEVTTGDLVAISGMEKCSVSDTIGDFSITQAIPASTITPPTMAITIRVNDSPLVGTEGSKVTSRLLRERLFAEAGSNVAITVQELSDVYEVGGRGELQLGILIENMRREGYELAISRPRVLFKKQDGQKLEPIEEVMIEVSEEFSSVVMEKLLLRKGKILDMEQGDNCIRMTYLVPTRGLLGYQSEFLTDTRGTGTMHHTFHKYSPYCGEIVSRRNGVLIALEQGEAVAYALFNLQNRGILFIKPQDKVYCGMIVGQHSRENDLEVNVLKGKQLSNMRAAGSDEAIRLTTPLTMTLEEMMTYIADDELLEVTPKSLRLRKKFLTSHERRKAKRKM